MNTSKTRTMFSVLAIFAVLGIHPTLGFLPSVTLSDCPNHKPQPGIDLDKVVGSWRLGYLFTDENDDLEEDNTCLVTEIMQVNKTQLALLLYIDSRKDEHTIDRYTKDFTVTILKPGEWLLQTPFQHLEFIHITLIKATDEQLILTFCADPFVPKDEPEVHKRKKSDDNKLPNDIVTVQENVNDIFKPRTYDKFFPENVGPFDLRRFRRPSLIFRGKRNIKEEENSEEEKFAYDRLLSYIKSNKSLNRTKKHLSTAIFVKDNDTSALRFVENASLLMKYGYNLTKGQLISFGGCRIAQK